MKKLLISFAALALLSACSDDENDENNNGQQPTLLTKQIAKIELTETEDGYTDTDNWEFSYNNDGKITAITGYVTATYNGNKVTVKDEDGDGTSDYTLENGRASACTYTARHEDESSKGEYRYTDGYLSKAIETGDGYVATYTYSFQNGNLV